MVINTQKFSLSALLTGFRCSDYVNFCSITAIRVIFTVKITKTNNNEFYNMGK